MNSTIHRLRSWVVTAIAATTLLSTGVILGTSGTASAVANPPGSISAGSIPTLLVRPTIATLDQAAGNLTLNFPAGTVLHNGDTVTVVVTDNAGAPLRWDGVPTFAIPHVAGSPNMCVIASLTGPVCPNSDGTTPLPSITGDSLTFDIGNGAGASPFTETAGGSIVLSDIFLDVPAGAATGYIYNTARLSGADTMNFLPVLHPGGGVADASSNGVISPAAAAPTVALRAVTTPALAIGQNDQTAGSWNLFLTSPAAGSLITAGDQVNIVVADDAGKNCDPGTLGNPDTVQFSSIPNLDITAGVGSATAVPTATASLAAVSDGPLIKCAPDNINNDLTITFTNTTPVVLTGAGLGIEIQITGVKYDVSSGATIIKDQGDLAVGSAYSISGFPVVLPAPGSFSTAPAILPPGIGGPSNGDIGSIQVVGNTPPSDIQLDVTTAVPGSEAVNQPISPITITEDTPGALTVPNGYVCVSLVTGGEWDASTSTPTVTGTNGLAAGPVSVETTGPFAGDSTLVFQVTAGDSGTPGVLTLSGLNVSVSQSLFTDIANGLVLVTYNGSNINCLGGISVTQATKAFSVSGSIWGVTPDATATQAFAVGNPGGNNDAVLATDADPYDALSASYLAGQLDTGILLTPTASLSTDALTGLRVGGVQTVYVVGGPDAVSQADITQLESTPSYFPGGTVQRYDAFTNDAQDLVVQWIYGQTADGTAALTAQYVGNHPLGQPAFQAGYGGQYNDTTGSSGSSASSAPDGGVNTAVIATDTGFQDSASASVMAYKDNLPLILSPPTALSGDAVAALDNDGIEQAIVMGGPDVINDSVVTQLEGMGIAVLRIAGIDYTDTSQEAAQFELNLTNAAGQFDGLGFSTSSALGLPDFIGVHLQSLSFARGDYYTDALVSAQINAALQEPELLTENPTTLGTYDATFLAAEGNPATAFGSTQIGGPGFSVDRYVIVGGQAIFGGPLAVAPATITQIATDIGPDQIPFP